MPRAVSVKPSLFSKRMIDNPLRARQSLTATRAERGNFACSRGQEMDILRCRTRKGDAHAGIQIWPRVNDCHWPTHHFLSSFFYFVFCLSFPVQFSKNFPPR